MRRKEGREASEGGREGGRGEERQKKRSKIRIKRRKLACVHASGFYLLSSLLGR